MDKIFAGGISHYGLLPRKISSKSEHLQYQKLCSKIQNSGKKNLKIVFEPETLPWGSWEKGDIFYILMLSNTG